MKKNVLFWIGVKRKSDLMLKKHGQFEYLEISKLSWKYWCDKNNVIFYEYKESSESDTGKHRVTWTRWFDVFNQLNQSNIDQAAHNYWLYFLKKIHSLILLLRSRFHQMEIRELENLQKLENPNRHRPMNQAMLMLFLLKLKSGYPDMV